jgi:hypothetical protein
MNPCQMILRKLKPENGRAVNNNNNNNNNVYDIMWVQFQITCLLEFCKI